MNVASGPRLLRTVFHLRPSQPLHRIRLRAQRIIVGRAPGLADRLFSSPGRSDVGWPSGVSVVDEALHWPNGDEIASGHLRLLDESIAIGYPFAWRPDAPQLWRFHLHYWDWAWGLVTEPDRGRSRATFHSLYRSWSSDNPIGGPGDAWAPYVASLRAWSWCGQYPSLVRGSDLQQEFVDDLARHAAFLRWHLELDVGGNHLIKNLKALIGLGVFFGDQVMTKHALGRLVSTLETQILPDGGHFERAPAYHCQVLADLIDVSALLGDRTPAALLGAIAQMRRWLGLVILPDGTVPLLNDGFPVAPELLSVLSPGTRAKEGLTLLPDTGFAVLKRGPIHLLADVGPPCPDDLPAHAHADTLGFLLYVDQDCLVSEQFTSTYAAGPERDAERGTAAHSTVQLDGIDSTEVWGSFRAGRRARATVVSALDGPEGPELSASHDGYRHLQGRPVHTRTWIVRDGKVTVIDQVTGKPTQHAVVVRLHGTPLSMIRRGDGVFVARDAVRAEGWMRRTPTTVLEYSARVQVPWRLEVELETGAAR